MIVTECRLITNDDASPCIDDVEKLGIKLTGLQPLNRVGVVVSPVELPTGTVAPGVEDLYTAAAFRNTTCMVRIACWGRAQEECVCAVLCRHVCVDVVMCVWLYVCVSYACMLSNITKITITRAPPPIHPLPL